MKVQKVQKVHKVQRVVVGGFAASMDKTFETGPSPGENKQTALRALKMHPFWCCRTTFPPEGGTLSANML